MSPPPGRRRGGKPGKDVVIVSYSSVQPGDGSGGVTGRKEGQGGTLSKADVLATLPSLRDKYGNTVHRGGSIGGSEVASASNKYVPMPPSVMPPQQPTSPLALNSVKVEIPDLNKEVVTEPDPIVAPGGAIRKSGRVPKRKRLSISPERERPDAAPGPPAKNAKKQDLPPTSSNSPNNNTTTNKTDKELVGQKKDQAHNDPFKTPVKGEPASQGEPLSVVGEQKTIDVDAALRPPEGSSFKVEDAITHTFFKGKEEFGAAIMIIVDQDVSSNRDVNYDQLSQTATKGWLQCGVCNYISEIDNFAKHKKHGAFMCTNCIEFLAQMVKIAKRAEEIICIGTSGTCDVSSESEEYCEACFTRNCLLLLDLSDEIYFKLYRSVQPSAKSSLPTQPPTLKRYSKFNRGKVVFVRQDGVILHTTFVINKTKPGKKSGVTAASISKGTRSGAAKKNSESPLMDVEASAMPENKRKSARESLKRLPPSTPPPRPQKLRVKQVKRRISIEDELPRATFSDAIELKKAAEQNTLNEDEDTDTCEGNDLSTDPESGPGDSLETNHDEENENFEAEPIHPVRVFPQVESTEELEEAGFPVIINAEANQEPPKPLCFSCGSAGINQLIFCCNCCEPFHPYCSEDELLLSLYIEFFVTAPTVSPTHSQPQYKEGVEGLRKKFRKWKCHRCITCRDCGHGRGSGKDEDFVGCSLCANSFHLKCAKKMPLRPTEGNNRKWVCGGCLQCTSCGVPLTKNSHHLRKLSSDDKSTPDILCLECFRRRQKGAFCPVCLITYDDNDWDSKMMECEECQRWVHAHCEDLNEEKYFILGDLPPGIPYKCRLCVPPSNIGWRHTIERELYDGCLKTLELFRTKSICMSRKRRALSFEVEDTSSKDNSSPLTIPSERIPYFSPSAIVGFTDPSPILQRDKRPSGLEIDKEQHTLQFTPVKLSPSEQDLNSPKKLMSPNSAKSELESSLLKQFKIRPCIIRLTDMDVSKFPKESSFYGETPVVRKMDPELKPVPLLPHEISSPVKVSTPNRVSTSFNEAVKSTSPFWLSIRDFRNISLKLLPSFFWEMTCTDKYEAEDKFLQCFDDSLKQVFKWWREDLKVHVKKRDLNDNEEDSDEFEVSEEKPKLVIKEEYLPDSIVFEDVYWNQKKFIDHRRCSLCKEKGDFPLNSCGRLLYVNPKEWIHVNCAIWSSEVWEEEDGGLQQVESAIQRGNKTRCAHCMAQGATLNCCSGNCDHCFHFLCAIEGGCALQTDKSVFCSIHSCFSKGEIQKDMHVTRKVFVGGNAVVKRKELRLPSKILKTFIGCSRIDKLGRLVPISVFESKSTPSQKLLLPVNFQVSLISLTHVADSTLTKVPQKYKLLNGKTILNTHEEFRVKEKIDCPPQSPPTYSVVIDHTKRPDWARLRRKEAEAFWAWASSVPKYVDEFNIDWTPVYKPPTRNVTSKKKKKSISPVKTKVVPPEARHAAIEWRPCGRSSSAEDHNPNELKTVVEGRLAHPRLRFLFEQLPGVEHVGGAYTFAHSSPSLYPEDGPLSPTVSGAARCELFRSKKPFDMFSWLKSKHRKPPSSSTVLLEETISSRGLPIAMRFRNLRERAAKDLMVLPSHIHGRGLFARRDIELGEMLIEYAGEMIRSVLCDIRERKYELAGIGCYMFRVNRERVVDATMFGNAARFINHSCDPNCESKAVKILGKDHILIFALKNIGRGEELTYDYKFERELDDKLPCSCGTKRCRRFLN